MRAIDWAECLRRDSLLSVKDEHTVRWLVSDEASTEHRYEPGAVILREGENGDSIYLIGSGSAEAVLSASGGETIVLSVMQRGETFGEMGFFERKPRSATVRAREACLVLERNPLGVGGAGPGVVPRGRKGQPARHCPERDAGHRVYGDPTRLEQVVTNLLDNAVKYTPPGGRVEISIVADREVAVLTVEDTGAGIHRDVLPVIFDLFVQGSRTLARSEGGLGLVDLGLPGIDGYAVARAVRSAPGARVDPPLEQDVEPSYVARAGR